jgi:hypothetical protein
MPIVAYARRAVIAADERDEAGDRLAQHVGCECLVQAIEARN